MKTDDTLRRPQRQPMADASLDGALGIPTYGCACGESGTYWHQKPWPGDRLRMNNDGTPHHCPYTKRKYERKTR